MEDATMLESVLKSWADSTFILAKGSITEKDKAEMRQALVSNEHF